MKSLAAVLVLGLASSIVPVAAFAADPAPAAKSGADLQKSPCCAACRMKGTKLVGPAYKDIAAKYAGQKDAATTLAAKVKKGGSEFGVR